MRSYIFSVVLLSLVPAIAAAGEADIVDAKARETSAGIWTFSVSVRHADAGWGHYADAWEIVGPNGNVIAKRVLAHPHVDEQPFTRSLREVTIDSETKSVTIRAHDSVHGFGGATMIVPVVPSVDSRTR